MRLCKIFQTKQTVGNDPGGNNEETRCDGVQANNVYVLVHCLLEPHVCDVNAELCY